MARVVDLGPDERVLVKLILAADTERRLVLGRSPAQVDAGLQLWVDLLVDGTAEDLAVVDVRVDDEVAGGVTESKVVLGQLGLAGIESQLITQQPALKTNTN